jgi:hypothetical protein
VDAVVTDSRSAGVRDLSAAICSPDAVGRDPSEFLDLDVPLAEPVGARSDQRCAAGRAYFPAADGPLAQSVQNGSGVDDSVQRA